MLSDKDKFNIAFIELKKIRRNCESVTTSSRLKAESLFWRATGQGGIDYSRVRVQTSPRNTMEDAIIQLVDMETKERNAIQKYYENTEQLAFSQLLTLRYIKCLPWSQVAEQMNKSTEHVRNYMHKKEVLEYFDRYCT